MAKGKGRPWLPGKAMRQVGGNIMRTAIQAIRDIHGPHRSTNERLRQWGRHDTGLCSWCKTKETPGRMCSWNAR
eukprot:667840-Hanusia_phi.AAC.1